MDLRAIQKIRSSYMEFNKVLLIDRADGGVATAAEVADPWQVEDDEAIANGLATSAGVPTDPTRPTFMRCFLERARGHAKSFALAKAATWQNYAAPRRIESFFVAVDQDQAAIPRNIIDGFVRLNGFLANALDVQQWRVVNRVTGSTLTILSSDVASSFGITPSGLFLDELCHWSKSDLWDSLVSSAAKRKDCFLGIGSNAGNSAGGTSWPWLAREAARVDPRWYFRSLPCSASWISAETLAEQERLLPTAAYRRLWLNEWQDGSGDALTTEDIQAAIVLDGPPPDATLVPRGERPSTFRSPAFVGLDVGVRRDHTGVVCLAARDGRAELLFSQGWRPHSTLGVDLADVRRVLLGIARRYGAEVYYDPSQAEAIAQDLRANGVRATAFPFTATNTTAMANTLVSTFRERKISLYRDEALVRDLSALTIAEKPNAHNSYKLQARRSADGSHADVAFALCIALVPAMQAASDSTNDAETARAVGQFVFDQRRMMRRSPRVY